MSNFSVFDSPGEKETPNFKQQIIENKDLLKEVNVNGSSLLHISIMQGDCDIAKFLIDEGIDVNKQDKMGNTALHYCAESNQYEIAESILENKGSLNISDRHGNEPLWTAILLTTKEEVIELRSLNSF